MVGMGVRAAEPDGDFTFLVSERRLTDLVVDPDGAWLLTGDEAGGAGGQSVARTSNCVILRHVPSGLQVRCHARQPQHGERLRAARHGQLRDLAQAARDERGAGVQAQLHAIAQAGGNGQYIFDRTAHLHTQDYLRVRIGIGKPPSKERGAGHVLSKLPPKERVLLDVAIQHAADAVEVIIADGIDVAQRTYNSTLLDPAAD
jgi:hypothetical protein